MITFKRYLLQEMHYGSLVNQEKYDELDDDDQALYKYTADAFTSVRQHYDELNKKYPFDGGVLYRGLHFETQKQHDEFLEKIKDGKLEISSTSSWTPSKSTAQDFAHSKKSYFPTPELIKASRKKDETGDHMTGYGGIVLKTKVEKGVGIDVKKSEFAKESEVILPEGHYQIEIEELLEPYARKYDTPEKVNSIIRQLAKAKDRTKDLDRLLDYVSKSWLDKLDQDQIDVIAQYRHSKVFAMPIQELVKHCITYELEKDYFRDGDHDHHLKLDVSPPFGHTIYEKASDKFKNKMDKIIKAMIKELGAEIKKLVDEPNLDKVDRFDIRGANYLKQFDESGFNAAIAPLKKFLGNKYHQMNSRETNRKLTSHDAIKDHGKQLAQIISAISSL